MDVAVMLAYDRHDIKLYNSCASSLMAFLKAVAGFTKQESTILLSLWLTKQVMLTMEGCMWVTDAIIRQSHGDAIADMMGLLS